MNSSASSNQPPDGSAKKVRKPYTISKSRESWTEEEHDKFLEALQLFDRDWKKIEDYVGSKTVIQIRSHAQKYFLKVQKNGTVAHVPPPRPKRKASHPYPQKAPKTVSAPPAYTSASSNALATGYAPWNDNSLLVNHQKNGALPSDRDSDFLIAKDMGLEDASRINNCVMSSYGSSQRARSSEEFPNQGKPVSALNGKPDFAEVYSFIGRIFDPEANDHILKLKQMDPINFETVVLLMKNLTTNLSSPDFEPIKEALGSSETATRIVGAPIRPVISAE